MKCKQAEKLIIDVSRTDIDPEIKAGLEAHVLNCPKCSSFRENFHLIHQEIDKLKTPEPPIELLDKTTALCHNELIGQTEVFYSERSHRVTVKTPKFIWVALGVFLLLTIVWACPVLKELAKDQIITQQTIFVITIIIQNFIMLFFAPVLLRSVKLKSNWINFQQIFLNL